MEKNTPDSVQQYVSTLIKAVEVSNHLSTVTDETVTGLLNDGLNKINHDLETIGSDTEVSSFMVDAYTTSINSLKALESLRGVLPDETIEETSKVHRDTITFAGAFATRHGIELPESMTIQVNPVEETHEVTKIEAPAPTTALQEADHNRKPLKVTILKGIEKTFVKFGEQGRPFSLSSKEQEKQRDYTEFRIKAIEFIVSCDGKDFTSSDLYRYVGIEIADKIASQAMRRFLGGLTYRRSPIVTHNGKHGTVGGYTINPNFDLSLETKDYSEPSTDKTTKDRKVPESTYEPVIDTVITAETSDNDTTHTLTPTEISIPELESFIDIHDAAIVLGVLNHFSDLLQKLDIKVPSNKLLEEILEISDSYDKANGIKRCNLDKPQLLEERISALDNVRSFMQDQVALENAVVNTPEDSPLYPLIEYLLDLDSEDSWETLLTQVLPARFETATVEISTRAHGQRITGLQEEITLPNGRVFRRTSQDGNKGDLIEIINTPYRAPEIVNPGDEPEERTVETNTDTKLQETAVIIDTPPSIPATGVTPEEVDAEHVKSGRIKSTDSRLDTTMQPVLEEIKSAVLERNAPISGGVTYLRTYFPWITAKTVREAVENNIISENKGTLTIEDVIRIGMWNRDNNLYGLRKNKKEIDKKVARVVEVILVSRNKGAKKK